MTTNDPMLNSQAPDPPDLPLKPGEEKSEPGHDAYAALRHRDYRRYFIGNAFSLMGMRLAGVAIGWELYKLTESKMVLGLVGLVQIIPIFALALPAGHIIDRVNRQRLIVTTTSLVMFLFIAMGLSSRYGALMPGQSVFAALNAGLAWISGEKEAHFIDAHVPMMLMLLLFSGMLRAVNQPAKQTIMPMLVPPRDFANAVTWNSSLFEVCNMVGPSIAGAAIWAFGPGKGSDIRGSWVIPCIYWSNALAQGIQVVNFALIKLRHPTRKREPLNRKTMLAGVNFVLGNKIVLGAMTLDMFAVLLGGATALLPVFADKILHVGPMGFGMLLAAPSVGAFSMGMILAHRPPMKQAGRNMLWAVAGFGAATIVFGLSTSFILSLIALVFTGVFDNISVVVRHTLVQLLTPDSMRGRVNAVNSVFISSSNELGAFRDGVTATWFGPMLSVALGGLGTIAVVGAVARAWPQILTVKRLKDQVAAEPQGFPVVTPEAAGEKARTP